VDETMPTQVAQLITGPLDFLNPEPVKRPPPATGVPLSNVPSSGVLEFIDPTPPKVSTPEENRAAFAAGAKDVVLSGAAEAARSIPSLMRGAVGSTERILGKDLPTLVRDLYFTGMEKADFISPAEAEHVRQSPLFGRTLTPEQKAGNVSPYTSQPTFKGTREELMAKPELFGVEMPLLARKPEGPAGEIAQETVMGAITGLPGAVRTVAGRVLSGAAAGAAGEAAGQATKGEENEPYWRLAWALGGGFAGAKGANALLPAATARDEIADALLRDMSKGQAKMTADEVREAIREGRPVTLLDMAGPETMQLIQKKAGTSALNQTRLTQFNADMAERSGQAGDRVDQSIASAMGRPINVDAFEQAMKEQGSRTRDLVFSAARANPAADAIPNGVIGNLLTTPSMREAMRQADISAEELTRYNIVAPSRIPAVAPVEAKNMQTPLGLRTIPGTPGRPEVLTEGNLNYWHKVDQKLGDMTREAQRNGKNDLASEYIDAQQKLRRRLYTVVPEYETALGVSRRTFVGDGAPQQGFNFAQTVFSAAQNPFRRGEVRREFASMSPENQEALSVGVAHFLAQKALKGDVSLLAKKFRDDGNFQRDMQTVLGEDRYYQIAGSVLAEDVLRRIPKMTPAAGGPTAGTVGLTAGLGAAAYENVGNIMQMQMSLPPETLTKMLIAAAVGAAGKTIYGAADRRVANALIPMVFSQDPRQVAQLARLVEENAVAKRVFNRMTTTLATAYDQNQRRIEREEKQQGQRPARASGGAVNLNALAKMAKKHVTSNTEQLLNQNDDTVAKALEVANRHI